ncbi:alpha/beta-hydrolase [Jackrogersella minutella]|nr:alpha/beta-hydrolase [Jackrogersella minutella]
MRQVQDTGGYYNFSKIRYGGPPGGNLRFKAPVEPSGRDKCMVTDGSTGRFAQSYLAGLPFNYDLAMSLLPGSPAAASTDPRTTEDCLFLDVIAPRSAFAGNVSGLPVLIWIYGGGYAGGEKTGLGKFNPAGLLEVSGSDPGFVFVAINYRPSGFGWLGGDEVGANGTRNAGLYDQRLAFQWVQKYIHLFSGDKDRVTAIGASASAGSIMHHITSFGPILFSPAFLPTPTNYIPTMSSDDLMKMQTLPGETLVLANALQIYSHAPYGSNIIMVSHNTLEGLTFTKPNIKTTEDYINMLRQAMSTISNDTLSFISNTLYPVVFNGSYGYKGQFQRALVTVQDNTIICNTRYLVSAMSGRAYGIQFTVQPVIHGEETPYVFQNGLTSGVIKDVADRLQQYIVNFVMNSKPTDANGLPVPLYGTTAQLMNIAESGSTVIKDNTANSRCSWWQ